MLTIYKFPLEITDSQVIKMPKGSRILSIKQQRNRVCLWAEVDTSEEIEDVTILCFGTGQVIPSYIKKEFIASLLLYSGDLVFHFFKAL